MTNYTPNNILNISTAYKTIVPTEYLESLEDGRKYHIYLMLSCPKIFIKPDLIIKLKEGISITLYKIENGKEYLYPAEIFKLHDEIDHTIIEFEIDFPFTTLYILGGKGERVPIEAQSLFNDRKTKDPWIFDVLYIGQSYGKDGSHLSQDILDPQSNFHRISTDFNIKYPDKRICIFLAEISPVMKSNIDNISEFFSLKEDVDNKKFKNVFAKPLKLEQMINITEAALINYFKPDYNVNFVENFSNSNNKGYKQYFDLDYSTLILELDVDFGSSIPPVQLFTKTNSMKISYNFIRYNLNNEPNRKSMYEIFK